MTGLLHLVDRAERGALLPAEAQQLRDGIRALLDNTATHAAVRPPDGPEHPHVADDMPGGARGAVAGAQDRECRCHNRQGLTAEQHENDCPFACPAEVLREVHRALDEERDVAVRVEAENARLRAELATADKIAWQNFNNYLGAVDSARKAEGTIARVRAALDEWDGLDAAPGFVDDIRAALNTPAPADTA